MRGRAGFTMVCALVAALLLLAPVTARALPGGLDPTFNGDGRLSLDVAGGFVARAVAVQPDGRIVVAGYSCAPPVGADATCLTGGGSAVRLARLLPDGRPDPTFGTGGVVTTPIGTRAQAYDLLRLPTGALVVAGVVREATGDRFLLAKFTADGVLARGFGSNGAVAQAIGPGFAAATTLGAGPNGTIFAAGQASDSSGSPRMAVARFTADGRLDTSWGAGGVQVAGAPYGFAQSLVVLGGGPVLAGVGALAPDPALFRFGLLRLLPGGALDPGFDGDGWTLLPARAQDPTGFANAVTGDGAAWIAAGTTSGAGAQEIVVLRGGPTGALDAAFGTGGRVVLPLGQGAAANDVLVQQDGQVVVVGQVRIAGGYSFATARLSRAGRLDPFFGLGGVAAFGFDRPVARATAGALQSDGRLVTVGVGCVNSDKADCADGRSILLAARQMATLDAPAVPVPPAAAPPAPVQPARPAAPRPRVRVSRPAREVSRRRLRRKGVRVRIRTSVKVTARVRLRGHRRTGRRHRWFTLARARVRRPQRSVVVRVRPGRRAVAKVRRGRLRLDVRLRTRTGVTIRRSFTIRLR